MVYSMEYLSNITPPAASAIVASVIALFGVLISAVLNWLIAGRKLSLDRRVETLKVFLEVSQRAQSRPIPIASGHEKIGETMAAMYLLADMSRRDRWLRTAGREQLHQELDWLKVNQGPIYDLHEKLEEDFDKLCAPPRSPQDEIDRAFRKLEIVSENLESWDRLIRAASDARAILTFTIRERLNYRWKDRKNSEIKNGFIGVYDMKYPLPPSVRNSSTVPISKKDSFLHPRR